MGTTIVARFADGRLLVQESRMAADKSSPVQIRVGLIGHVEKVLSVSTSLDKYGLRANLDELTISKDIVTVHLRRADIGGGVLSGVGVSIGPDGSPLGYLSGITSGLAWMGELVSGALISGLTVTLNVVGH